MNLYSEHLILHDSGIQHRRVNQLKANDYNPEYLETKVAPSESSDYAYLLGRISVLSVPFAEADVSKDTIELWICGCSDFHFNQSDGVEAGERRPPEIGECKHIRQEIKSKRAQDDENQIQLGGVNNE